jgi:hypothetical protein
MNFIWPVAPPAPSRQRIREEVEPGIVVIFPRLLGFQFGSHERFAGFP